MSSQEFTASQPDFSEAAHRSYELTLLLDKYSYIAGRCGKCMVYLFTKFSAHL